MGGFLLIAFGIVLLVVGGFLGYFGTSEAQDHRRLEDMDPLAPDDWQLSEPAEGYVEGHLSEANPIFVHGFVFYFRSVFSGYRGQGEGRSPTWRSEDRRLPPLLVETDHGSVRITRDYAVTFLGSDPTWVTPGKLQAGVSERFEGLPPGQPVVVVGTPVLTEVGQVVEAEVPLLDARTLGSGTFEDLHSGARSGALFLLIAAGVLVLAGLILLGVGVGQIL